MTSEEKAIEFYKGIRKLLASPHVSHLVVTKHKGQPHVEVHYLKEAYMYSSYKKVKE